MLLQIFSENEIVQILDPATSIWESAKIIAFINDWCVRIKWVDWSSKKKEDIAVPEKDRSERNCWNIRKSQRLVLETTQKRRSTPLVFNACRLVRRDQVYFWQPECDCVDTDRCRDDRCCGSVVMGSVKINDHFINQCLVTDVEGNDVFVSYRQLRNKPCSRETNPDNENDEDGDSECESARPPIRKQARVTFAPQPQPQMDIISLLPSVDDDVDLTYVPCANDIIKVGSIASYADDEFEIKRLFYDHQRKKAFASMQSRIDPDIEVRIPSNRIVSKSSSKGEVLDFNSITEPIDQAFALFSAIKRIVGLSKNKHSITATLVPCTPLTKKLCGFKTNNCKEAVKYSVTNKEGMRWCNGTWDNVLGRMWDLIPCYSSDGEDVLIKTMRFTENREFGMFTIRVQILTTQGHYKTSCLYRELSQNVPSSNTTL